MSADWSMSTDSAELQSRTHVRLVGGMLTGRVELTGAARHAPRTVEFAYAPSRVADDDCWRITHSDQLLWLETPDGYAVDRGRGLTWTGADSPDEVFARPAPEVTTLRSLRSAASRLDVDVPAGPSDVAIVEGRPCTAYEVAGPRRARFVVDDETRFVLRVEADGVRGPQRITVTGFAVERLEPALFRP